MSERLSALLSYEPFTDYARFLSSLNAESGADPVSAATVTYLAGEIQAQLEGLVPPTKKRAATHACSASLFHLSSVFSHSLNG